MSSNSITVKILFSCAMALLLGACAGSSPSVTENGHESASQSQASLEQAAAAAVPGQDFGLPSPAELLRSTLACGDDRIIKAGPLNPSPLLQPRNLIQEVGPDGSYLRFAPSFGAGGDEFEDISYVMHFFSFEDYPFTGTQIRFDWETAPSDPSNLYVALANWDTLRYKFFQTADSALLETGEADFAPFTLEENSNTFVLVTLLIGDDPAILRGIQIGDDPEPLVEVEPNDTMEEAMPLDVDEFGCLQGLIGGAAGGGEDDWYAFEVTEIGDFLLELQCDSEIDNLNIFVYNPFEKLLLSSANPGNAESVNYRLIDLGTYYLHVQRVSGSLTDPAPYSFFSSFEPVELVFLDEEPNNDSFNAQVLPALPVTNFGGRLGSRQLNANDFADFFQFTIEEAGEVSVDLLFRHSQANIDLYLTGTTGTLFFASSESEDDNEEVNFQFNQPGDYLVYLRYRHVPSEPFVADYVMNVTFNPGGGYDEAEPNNSIEEAQPITLPLNNLVGAVGNFGEDGGDDDYFGFSVDRAGEISISLESNPQQVNVDMALLRSDGTAVASALTFDAIEQINVDLPSEGRYYIWVLRNTANGAGGDYSLSASFVQGPACNSGEESEPNDGGGFYNDMPYVNVCDFVGVLGGEVIEEFDGWDEYRFEVGDSGQVNIDLFFSHAENDLGLWLTTDDGGMLIQADDADDNESISFHLDNPGFYRIVCISNGINQFASYELDVNFTHDTP